MRALTADTFRAEEKMSFFVWTVIVGVIGWGATLAMKSGTSNHHVLHLAIGIAGALLGGLLMTAPERITIVQTNDINGLSLLVSFFIAMALSMIANLWHRVHLQDEAEMDR